MAVYKLSYANIDGCRRSYTGTTLKGAQAFVSRWVGTDATVGSLGYAVSADGIGKVWISGQSDRLNWADLLPNYEPFDFAAVWNAEIDERAAQDAWQRQHDEDGDNNASNAGPYAPYL